MQPVSSQASPSITRGQSRLLLDSSASSLCIIMFHVAVLDFFICSHSALVDFQVSGPAQRRT